MLLRSERKRKSIPVYRGKINLEDFEPVLSPVDKRRAMAINISTSGHLAMNERFCAELKNRCFDFRASKDKKMIMLKEDNSGHYTFPKSGRIKDEEFVRSLSAAGLYVPCRYIMKYCEEMEMWVGEYNDTAPAGKHVLEREMDRINSKKARRKTKKW